MIKKALLNPADYILEMRKVSGFRNFAIEPQFTPGIKDIDGFIHDEVVRQGHDPRIEWDGGVRINWMRQAWNYAQENADRVPTFEDIDRLGRLCEFKVNHNGFRVGNIWIGGQKGAPPGLIPEFVTLLSTKTKTVNSNLLELSGPHPDEYRDLWNLQFDIDDIAKGFRKLISGIHTALDWYAAYEAIHPWNDGNGRSGKVLSCWLGQCLDDPILVPDLFGGGNP